MGLRNRVGQQRQGCDPQDHRRRRHVDRTSPETSPTSARKFSASIPRPTHSGPATWASTKSNSRSPSSAYAGFEAAHFPAPVKTWHCGTLVYTKAGLVTLFTFLLFRNFAFNLMMSVIPSILPLKLKSLGASDWVIGLLISSVFPLFGMFVSPYLVLKRLLTNPVGARRMPFFFFSLPLVTGSILLLAFSESIAGALHRSGILATISPTTAVISVMGCALSLFNLRTSWSLRFTTTSSTTRFPSR